MAMIQGDVDVVGISNLLEALSTSGRGGYLTVEQEEQKKVIHFSERGFRVVSGTKRVNPLGEILVRTGRLTRERLDDILIEQRTTRIPLGELVAKLGILPLETIQHALREQVAEEVYDLFTWWGAKFEFNEAEPGIEVGQEGPLSSIFLDVNMMSIMLEAARRIDELSRIRSVIPDVRLIPERLELPAALEDPSLDEDAIKEILPLIDGERSVGHIIEESLYPKFTVLRTLFGLSQRGVLKIHDRGEGDSGPITIIRGPGRSSSGGSLPMGRKVLLVSDLRTFRLALATCLRAVGLDVIEYERLDEPFDLTSLEHVDVVVLDVPLETEGSLALCARLRDTTQTPFILLSANTSRNATANALRSGARYVLVKPIREELLIERLMEVIGGETKTKNE